MGLATMRTSRRHRGKSLTLSVESGTRYSGGLSEDRTDPHSVRSRPMPATLASDKAYVSGTNCA